MGSRWPMTLLLLLVALLASVLYTAHGAGRSGLKHPPNRRRLPPRLDSRRLLPKNISLTLPDYSYYHTWQSLLDDVEALVHRHPQLMAVEKFVEEKEGYGAEVDVVTIAQQTGGRSGGLRALLTFGQHAREVITTEVALRLLQLLANETAPTSMQTAGELQRVLEGTTIKMVPIENVNGRKVVEAGVVCHRENGRGVDINRNWDVDWGVLEDDYRPAEENPGMGPFSEPESSVMREVVTGFAPHLWLNVHSGEVALFTPYEHTTEPLNISSLTSISYLLNAVNNEHCAKECLVGEAGRAVGYLAHGTSTDYVFEVANVPIASTWEIFGDPFASLDDCFRGFNPTTKAAFENEVERWAEALITAMDALPAALHLLYNGTFPRSPPGLNTTAPTVASPPPVHASTTAPQLQQPEPQGGSSVAVVVTSVLVAMAVIGLGVYVGWRWYGRQRMLAGFQPIDLQGMGGEGCFALQMTGSNKSVPLQGIDIQTDPL